MTPRTWGLAAAGLLAAPLFLLYRMDASFDRSFRVDAPPEAVWVQLELAFLDSRVSAVWPNELESLSCRALLPGSPCGAELLLPSGGRLRLSYRLRSVENGRRIVYEPGPAHPFEGSATVEVSESEGGTLVRWRGDYRQRGLSLAAPYFKLGFEERFFRSLEAGFRRWARPPS